MVFSSWEFIFIYLIIVLGVLNAIREFHAKLVWLTICSYVFYGLAGAQYTLLLLLVTTVDYIVGNRIAATEIVRKRRLWLAASLSVNLGMLGFFKYANFIWRNLLDLLATCDSLWGASLVEGMIGVLQYETIGDAETFLKFVLPPGISFYVFQSLSYTLDVYWNKVQPERRFWKFACFVSLFPQLIAGPIVRYIELAPQMEAGLLRQKSLADWEAGILRFSIGLCKKVLIADRLGSAIDPLIADYHHLDLVSAWVVMIGFAYQLYFDFSGYSDMAIGLGKVLGFNLPMNFDSPYQALNPSDFWARWHITLSRWIRDYLYVPLGGSRGGRLLTLKNLSITMILAGLWHGASWNFVVWGMLHGAYLIAYHSAKTYWDAIPPWIARTLMFVLVVIAWVPFRAENLSMAKEILATMFGANGLMDGLMSDISSKLWFELAVAGTLAHLSTKNSNQISYNDLGYLRIGGLAVGTVLALISMNLSSKFLYFNF